MNVLETTVLIICILMGPFGLTYTALKIVWTLAHYDEEDQKMILTQMEINKIKLAIQIVCLIVCIVYLLKWVF